MSLIHRFRLKRKIQTKPLDYSLPRVRNKMVKVVDYGAIAVDAPEKVSLPAIVVHKLLCGMPCRSSTACVVVSVHS